MIGVLLAFASSVPSAADATEAPTAILMDADTGAVLFERRLVTGFSLDPAQCRFVANRSQSVMPDTSLRRPWKVVRRADRDDRTEAN
jgi:hypothetical protein